MVDSVIENNHNLLSKTVSKCLDFNPLGFCNDFFQNEYSVYNVGAALSAISIIFALATIMKPLHRVRIRHRPVARNIGIMFLVLNLLFVFTAAIVPYIAPADKPIWAFHILWEILGGISFVISFCIFLIIGLKRIKNVAPNDLNKILELCLISIAYGSDSRESLAQELGSFIGSLVKQLNSKEEESRVYANQILQVCADSELCKIIVHQEPKTFQEILLAFKNASRSRSINSVFIKELFLQSFISDNSLLVRELSNSDKGLGSINGGNGIFSRLIFEDYSFIDRLSLLGEERDLFLETRKFSKEYQKNYIQFWEGALKSFFKSTNNPQFSSSLRAGFTQAALFIREDLELREISYYWMSYLKMRLNDPKVVKMITDFYGETLPTMTLNYRDGKEYRPEFLNTFDFFDVFAEGIYGLMAGVVSQIKKRRDNNFKRHLNMQIFSIIDENNPVTKAIELRLEQLIRQEIEENLRGYYPMITNAFFDIHGYEIFTHPDKASNFQKEILEKIGKKLPSFMKGYIYGYPANTKLRTLEKNKLKAKEIILDIFPEGMDYDPRYNLLTYFYFERRSASKINLNTFIKRGILEVKKIED